MTLSKQDKEWAELIVDKIATGVTEKLIEAHIKTCPHGLCLWKFKVLVIALALAVGAVSGVTSASITRYVMMPFFLP